MNYLCNMELVYLIQTVILSLVDTIVRVGWACILFDQVGNDLFVLFKEFASSTVLFYLVGLCDKLFASNVIYINDEHGIKIKIRDARGHMTRIALNIAMTMTQAMFILNVWDITYVTLFTGLCVISTLLITSFIYDRQGPSTA